MHRGNRNAPGVVYARSGTCNLKRGEMSPKPPTFSFRPSPGVGDTEILAGLGPRLGLPEDDTSTPMSERVVCEHADRCGGCPIIALPYGEQLAMKRGRVVQSASRY